MSTELSNGVIIPEEYSDDWYDEMSINLRKLNDVITAASDNATDIQRLDTDKANQSDLTALTSRVSQNETDITALQTAVSGALKREIVQTLPTEDISTTTIYMIRNSQSSGTNIYDEYMYINNLWELIGTSATDFSNYYTKNETDNLLSAKANQTDLTSLSGRVTQTETDITALQTAVSGALKREIVQSLPTQDISTTTIYMIRNTTTSGDNIYDEYMYINNLWELIGTSATDFSNYYTKTEIDTLLSDKANDSDVVHKSGNETVAGYKVFENICLSNSIKAINLENQTIDLNNCYSSFGLPQSGNISFYFCNTDGGTVNISNLPEQRAFFLISQSIRILSGGSVVYLKQTLVNSNGKTFVRYCNNSVWDSWQNVTNLVTTDTNQTISGNKTFSGNVSFYNSDASVDAKYLILRNQKVKRGSTTETGTQFITFHDKDGGTLVSYETNVSGSGNTQAYINVSNLDANSQRVVGGVKVIKTPTETWFTPDGDNTVSSGLSNYKWKDVQTKLINGLTPSSMSIPNFSGRVDITSYISNLTGATNNYTPSVNGWIYVGSNDASYLALFDTGSGGCGIRFSDGVVGEKYACIPCQAGRALGVKITCTNLVLAYFVPCLGNI